MSTQTKERAHHNGNGKASMMTGSLAGMLATIPMTLLLKTIQSRLPEVKNEALPPEEIMENVSERIGAKPIAKMSRKQQREDNTSLSKPASTAHFAFGSGAGALYPAITNKWHLNPIAKGALFGLLVWGSSYQGWLPGAKLYKKASAQPMSRNLMMIAAHLVWGISTALIIKKMTRA